MNFIFKGELIDYECFKTNSATTILFLHGWGGNKNSFLSTINLLKFKNNIISITLPTTEQTHLVWKLLDYCKLVKNILTLHNINKIKVVCHSFGFRVISFLSREFSYRRCRTNK